MLRLFVLLAWLSMLSPAAAQANLALVLAVDVSSSVNDERFHLQRAGIAAAIMQLDDDMLAHKMIELAVIEWSTNSSIIVPWTTITPETRPNIAGILKEAPRSNVGIGLTDVGLAISASLDLLNHVPMSAARRVIDVSGDGKQNIGAMPAAEARNIAVKQGIQVNGLPITNGGDPGLKEWYYDNVVGGGFMLVANGFDDFARAMRSKLMLEIADATR